MNSKMIAALVLVGGLTACGSNAAHAPTATKTVTVAPSPTPAPVVKVGPNQAFLHQLHAQTHYFDDAGDGKVIHVARLICTGWAAHMTKTDMTLTVAAELSPKAGDALVRAATATFCPQYSNRLLP